MVLGGLMRLWLLVMNFVYGCGFRMCLSGGFGGVLFFQGVLLSNLGWVCVLVDGCMSLVLDLLW